MPPEWHSWLHHIRKDAPGEDPVVNASRPPWLAVSQSRPYTNSSESVQELTLYYHHLRARVCGRDSHSTKTSPALEAGTSPIRPRLPRSVRGNLSPSRGRRRPLRASERGKERSRVLGNRSATGIFPDDRMCIYNTCFSCFRCHRTASWPSHDRWRKCCAFDARLVRRGPDIIANNSDIAFGTDTQHR